MTVFVAQEVTDRSGHLVHDLSPATRWGELEFLMPSGPVALNPQPMIMELRHKLRNYTDEDLLLAVGDPAVIGAAVAVAADMNQGRVRVLRWDKRAGPLREEWNARMGRYVERQRGDYVEVPMNLRGQQV